MLMGLSGCDLGRHEASSPDDVATKHEAVSLTCPSLSGSGTGDIAALFGIEPALAAKLERVVRLAGELEDATAALASKSDAVCASIATAVDAAPLSAGGSACTSAMSRVDAFRAKVRASGGTLAVKVANVRCSIPEREIATCAGECLTGVSGVVSKVECSGGAPKNALASTTSAECSGEIKLPNASGGCLAQCRARTLRALRCEADVDVTLDGMTVDPELRVRLDRLQREVPALVALGADAAARVAKLVSEIGPLVDDVAAAVDAMTSGGSAKERRVAVGAVLATCFAPPLARTVTASKKLATALDGAKELHARLVVR